MAVANDLNHAFALLPSLKARGGRCSFIIDHMTRMSYSGHLQIPIESATLEGHLEIPDEAVGLVCFSHGSGSRRFNPQHNVVAQQLLQKGMGIFLLDLLTRDEDKPDTMEFNIPLQADRLLVATRWLERLEATKDLPLGYFGAGAGVGSALVAAAQRPQKIRAIVSQAGRPDLALADLPKVKAPTLLIVEQHNPGVLRLNQEAFGRLRCERKITLVKGTTDLFEEPRVLEEVARLACDWFQKYFTRTVPSSTIKSSIYANH